MLSATKASVICVSWNQSYDSNQTVVPLQSFWNSAYKNMESLWETSLTGFHSMQNL